MNFIGELLLFAGMLLAVSANGCRTALPELVNNKGRDPSDRRREAAARLRAIWLGRVAGLMLIGAGAVLVSGHLFVSRWASATAVAFVAFIFSEVLPPMLIQRLPEGRANKLFAIPMGVLTFLFRLPARFFLGAEDRGADDWAYAPPDTLWLEQRRGKNDQEELEKEQELVDSILDFSDKIVREVMVPRIDMDSIELSDDIESIVAQMKKAGHSRIPVYRKKIDDIAGVLYAKDLLGIPTDAKDGEFHIEDIIREAYFVPEFKRIDELFAEFQTNRIHMAVVVDEYGGTAGIVTMEDIVEEVFGEIRDEYDSEPPMVRFIGNGSYRVDARLPIDDLNDLLETDFEEDENFESVGGLVYHRLGHIPESGESAEIDGWSFTVEKVSGQRILFVRVSPVTVEKD
jgi:putative hemolysin